MPASGYITLQLDEHGNHDLLILKADDVSAVRVNRGTGRVAFSAAHPHNLMGHAGEAMSLVGQPAKDFLDQWSKATGVRVPEFEAEGKAEDKAPAPAPAPAPVPAKVEPAKKAEG